MIAGMLKTGGILLAASVLAFTTSLPAHADAQFERTLHVGSGTMLHITTGAGDVRLSKGAADTIHIVGIVKRGCGWGNWGDRPTESQVQAIANNPPIEQTGNIVSIGAHMHTMNCLYIQYRIEAPADVQLEVTTGAGDITDNGVGQQSHLRTGSGDIRGTGLTNGFSAGTGSGNIVIESGGSGDVRASTGSGDITLHNLSGGLRATTGSGNLHVSGTPRTGWYLSTGSGDIGLTLGSASFTLDAHTGSGDIRCNAGNMSEVQSSHHDFHARIGGGGSTVEAHSGSGNIHIN